MWGMEWHHATVLWTKMENPMRTLWIRWSSRRKWVFHHLTLNFTTVVQALTRKKTNTTPTIDYTRSWLMTSNEFFEALHEKPRGKNWSGQWESKAKTRNKKHETKRDNERKINKKPTNECGWKEGIKENKFNELWTTKNWVAIGDALHAKIKESAPIVGYLGLFSWFMHILFQHRMMLL